MDLGVRGGVGVAAMDGRWRGGTVAIAPLAALAVLGVACALPQVPGSRFELSEPADSFEPVEPADLFIPEPRPPAPPPRQKKSVPAGVKLLVEPADASLFVDGVALGPANRTLAPSGRLELTPGLHRIVVEHEGRQTWRGEVVVGAQPVSIEVSLPESE